MKMWTKKWNITKQISLSEMKISDHTTHFQGWREIVITMLLKEGHLVQSFLAIFGVV